MRLHSGHGAHGRHKATLGHDTNCGEMQRALWPVAARLDLSAAELPGSALALRVRATARGLSLSAVARAGERRAAPPGGETHARTDPLQDRSIGLCQRFKRTFKQYGKVMVPVHLLTSTVWFGAFYYAAMKGVNLVPFLEYVGLPDRLVSVLRDSQGGNALTAYAMYKLATPARYTVTLGGTSLSVQHLRRHGHFSTPPPVTEYLQDRMEETRERLSEKMEETKERFSEKMGETKELISERMEETRGRFTEKVEETKEKLAEKLQETKDTVSFQKKTD
ncbi:LOW QUALITY PROTEIN: uncharacterized protein C18orf19 homolog B [Brachyhypopomus gauderio]|uniref:LOW QUALITY PROTEIN: uncharacterized protein C18orf19 homolog B n=1 Tax=Brachyhypopomus gauderio TaxID=698409 RepID=UPI00404258FA